MNDNNQKIELYFGMWIDSDYCTFNLKDEFILYDKSQDVIWIYSTQTKNNKWTCKKIYEIPEGIELISISKYDKLYLSSNDYIYEWDILTEKSIRIFENNENKVINIVYYFYKL